ncbi:MULTISPECIES: hypothetical protein [Paenibacillus]|uniref:hypothetical protein n=1 Tax=Paenibacillus TaxID=44249 RepID=UPI000845CF1F|nr:hypothetical protein [Paenibacillus polymyxa]AOK90099.1 hypothetical protein AOU00_09925 [Paenibacillus polymyxa]MCF2716106.1 hypothetical protein [Paenibacillus sp. UKAQ_18]
MKRAILALSISALALSLGGVASASPVSSTISVGAPATVKVTFVPANGEKAPIKLQDTEVPLGMGSDFYMEGSNWMLLYGSNVIKLTGNKATVIGYGTAQVAAYKSNGDKLGVYTFIVKR